VTGVDLVVTTSWDDGHVLDLRIAQLLERYGLTGTFYIAPESIELQPRQRLTQHDVRSLATRFEVGGHTSTHRRLPSLSLPEASLDIRQGKEQLEQTIGSAIRSFAYPGGEYDERHVEVVRDAGFVFARTVRRYITTAPRDPLEAGTTVHAYRHWRDVAVLARRARPRQLWNWDDLAIALFDQTLTTGGVFHLWGHGWEIDVRRDWKRLERVLDHTGGRPGVSYLPNGALVTTTGHSG
jgi:peptidoglycan/xylan/chitin deacetylase (PgdA/CDA1 family)